MADKFGSYHPCLGGDGWTALPKPGGSISGLPCHRMGHCLPRAGVEVDGVASLSTDAPIQGREAVHQPNKKWTAATGEGGNPRRSYVTALLH